MNSITRQATAMGRTNKRERILIGKYGYKYGHSSEISRHGTVPCAQQQQ
jgi:hypothetical protein